METWFTSDQHFWHKRICEYSNRPFSSVEEMNEALIERHNLVVKPNDRVFHLGDVGFCNSTKLAEIVRRLNGKKYLVLGNHDLSQSAMLRAGFSIVSKEIQTRFAENEAPWLLSHYPYTADERHGSKYQDLCPQDNGLWLLHGHVHELWKQKGRQINVGVDVWDYSPVHITAIRNLMAAP